MYIAIVKDNHPTNTEFVLLLDCMMAPFYSYFIIIQRM